MARALLLALALTGCAGQSVAPIVVHDPVEVRVPVPVGCRPPAELLVPVVAPLPEFVPACAPASSGLMAEGETRLQQLLWVHRIRVEAWEAWAKACEP